MIGLLLLLILLLPTIASTGLGRSLALGKINKRIEGKLSIESWSLGWFSGFEAEGIRIADPTGKTALTLGTIHTELTLPQLMGLSGSPRFGTVEISGLTVDLIVEDDGTTNLARALAEAKEKKEPEERAQARRRPKEPEAEIHGTFNLTNGRITIRSAPTEEPLRLDNITAAATLSGSEKPIKLELTAATPDGGSLEIALEAGPLGTIRREPFETELDAFIKAEGFALTQPLNVTLRLMKSTIVLVM